MLMILKGSCMANKNDNYKFIIVFIGIIIKIVKLGILYNSPVKIVSMLTKRSMRLNF